MEGDLTFAMIKPNVVLGGNIGAVVSMIEREGFEILAISMEKLTADRAKGFYAEHKGREFFPRLIDFITSGKVVVLILRKKEAVNSFRTFIGDTDPKVSEPQTVRSIFGETITKNAIHGSDSDENALKEITYFFPDWNDLC